MLRTFNTAGVGDRKYTGVLDSLEKAANGRLGGLSSLAVSYSFLHAVQTSSPHAALVLGNHPDDYNPHCLSDSHPSVSPSSYRRFQLELCPSADNPTSNIIRPSSFSPLNLQFLCTIIIPFSLQTACLPVPLMQSHFPAPRPFPSLLPPAECSPIITSPRLVCTHALLKVFA